MCLFSLHIDNLPGDREATCHGLYRPVYITSHPKKGYVIQYNCMTCGQGHKNKVAEDDSEEAIIALVVAGNTRNLHN